MTRLLLKDSGVAKTFVRFQGDQMVTETVQDVEPILNANARIMQLQQSKHSPLRLAASVPGIDYHRWRREWRETMADKWTWQTYLTMKLNSRDFQKFRTEDMRL